MSKHKVIGNHTVAGVEPGGFVDSESEDLAGANIEALVAAGHLEDNTTKPTASKAKEQ